MENLEVNRCGIPGDIIGKIYENFSEKSLEGK